MTDSKDKLKEETKISNEQEQTSQDLSGLITDKPIENINMLNQESCDDYNQDLLKQQTVLDYKVIKKSQIIRQSTIITESNIKNIMENIESSSQSSILSFSSEDKDYLTSRPLSSVSIQDFKVFISNYSNDLIRLNQVLSNVTIQSDFNKPIGPFSTLDHLIELTYKCNPLNKDNMTTKKNLFNSEIYQWRKVQGDGNCYYRAVIFSFIEKIILNNNQQLLMNLIFDVKKCFEDSIILSKINIKHNYSIKHSLVIRILIVIYHYLTQGNVNKGYEVFFKCLINCVHFDFGLILYLRYILYRFIKENETKLYTKDFPVLIGNLLPIEYEKSDGSFLFKDFYENYLLKMYQDAEKIVIYLTPFALCCNMNVFLFDLNADYLKEFKYYGSSNPNLKNCIEILNVKVHYELIYSRKEFFNHEKIFNLYKIAPSYQNVVLGVLNEEKKNESVNVNQNDTKNEIKINESGFCLFKDNDDAINKPKPVMISRNNNCMVNSNSYRNKDNSMNSNKQIQPQYVPSNPISPLNSNMNNKQNIITNSHQYSSQPVLTSSQQIPNYIKCLKCNNTCISNFKLKLCQDCVLNELKSNLYSLYLILISSNKVSFRVHWNFKAARELFKNLFKPHFILQNASISVNEALDYINQTQKDKKMVISFDSIMNENKSITCLNCENNINLSNKLTMMLPCGCRFCSPKCQRYFLEHYPYVIEKFNIQDNIICICGTDYNFHMCYQLALITRNASLPYYSNTLCSYLYYCSRYYCMICCKAPRKENMIYLKCKNFSLDYEKLFGSKGYNHSVCNFCYTVSKKTFSCSLCKMEHEVIGPGTNYC